MLWNCSLVSFVSVYFLYSALVCESTEETKTSRRLQEEFNDQIHPKVTFEEIRKKLNEDTSYSASIYGEVSLPKRLVEDHPQIDSVVSKGNTKVDEKPNSLGDFLKKIREKINLKFNQNQESTEYGEYFEGDMVIEENLSRSNILKINYWPGGVIPFDFDKNFPQEDRKRVLNVINFLNHKACLHFRKHWYFRDGATYIKITNKKPGCFATVGRPNKGSGTVNLAKSCMQKDGIIIHELLHSLGIFHEHSRYDRDNYVKIHWENIQSRDMHNFVMRNNFQVFGIPYDYYSIMHYSTHAYSKNGSPTLEPKILFVTTDAEFMSNSIKSKPDVTPNKLSETSINLIENLRKQIRRKENELHKAEIMNKNFERLIQLVNILGQVDTFLTEKTKTLIKKLATIAKEEDLERRDSKSNEIH